LHELVKGIYIEKNSGHWVQGIHIVYDLVRFISLDELRNEETT